VLPIACFLIFSCSPPAAWLQERGIRCTCVAGRAVRGNPGAEKKTLGSYAFNSYDAVRMKRRESFEILLPLLFADGESSKTGVVPSAARIAL
jgi:hypothetical protein